MPIYIYLNLAGVRGESKAKGHEGWIELDACTFHTGPDAAGD
jgi:type VI protein secretion system component Hcp